VNSAVFIPSLVVIRVSFMALSKSPMCLVLLSDGVFEKQVQVYEGKNDPFGLL
jgi:hypothetical protein